MLLFTDPHCHSPPQPSSSSCRNPIPQKIITNPPSTASTPLSKGRLMVKRDAQKKGRVMAKEWWKSRSNEQTIEDLVAMGVLHNKALRDGVRRKEKASPIHNQVRLWFLKISSSGVLGF